MQKEALRAYCQEHGIKVDQWVEDIGSALNYKRRGFNQIIEHIELGEVSRVVIGSQDRFVRFGYDWFEQFCERHGTQITVINGETFSPEEELVRDLIAVMVENIEGKKTWTISREEKGSSVQALAAKAIADAFSRAYGREIKPSDISDLLTQS
ncbi:hypothetical protein KDH_11640 [Dictyobacter sp. S3.2.2.5]|uniref:Resolvase/invertase-type recombinase catalytic domain-containing protein n=1 Tax=Dictyobacter halimunensis TaxID=3026934 RepID=A0ABQ6FKZ4_9CHLR|nr:hypothetical protein KDH_11640 [Dictyobacter sp. S3.2.2.5]